MKPWKRSGLGLSALQSIGLQWGHGDEAVEEASKAEFVGANPARFNGATAMKPWKSQTSSAATRRAAMLQWGHGDEAVEELVLGFRALRQLGASMGPRR